MKKYSIVILFFALLNSANAQRNCNLRLTGRVICKDSSLADNAEIFIESQHIRIQTSNNGTFIIRNICPGEVMLDLNAANSIHIHYFLTLSNDSAVILEIPDSIYSMHTALINKSRTDPNTLNRQAVLRNAGLNLGYQLEKIAGVQLLKTGNTIAKPMVQGMTGLRLPIYINGIKQEGQQWGNEHGPEMDPLGYTKFSIISGAKLLQRTHDAMAGIVEISSNTPAHEGESNLLLGSGFANNGRGLVSFLQASGRRKNASPAWYCNASYKMSGNLQTPDYYLLNTGSNEIGLNTGLIKSNEEYTKSFHASFFHFSGGIFSGSKIGNVQDLVAAINRKAPLYGIGQFTYSIAAPRQSATHAQSSYERENKHNRLLVSIQLDQRKEFDYHRSSAQKFPQLDLTLLNASVKQEYFVQNSEDNKITFGWSHSQYLNHYGGYYFIPDMLANTTGLHAFLSQPLQGKWQIESSLRLDYKHLNASWKLNGQDRNEKRSFLNYAAATSFIKKDKKSQIHLNLLRLWRAPWINELYSYGVHHGSAAFESGNKNLKSEIDYKLETEYHYKWKRMEFILNLYFNYIHDFINLSPSNKAIQTVRGAFPSYEYNQFNAVFSGSDLALKYAVSKHITYGTRSGYTYAYNLSSNVFPAYIPPIYTTHFFDYTAKLFQTTFEFKYTAKQNYFATGSDLLPPPKGFSICNYSLLMPNLGKKQNIELHFKVDNIFNTRYRNYLDRFRYFSDATGRNISLQIIIKFHHHYE